MRNIAIHYSLKCSWNLQMIKNRFLNSRIQFGLKWNLSTTKCEFLCTALLNLNFIGFVLEEPLTYFNFHKIAII